MQMLPHWLKFGLLLITISGMTCLSAEGKEMQVPVTFSGGHDTEPQDRGRPVVLVAAGLGVKPEVFRDAFRGVTPARGGRPSPEEARKNKQALMRVLGPLGVTNERLDEVSNYYRYQPQRGELWKNAPASAYAVVENGKIKKIVVKNAGSGYSSPPKATIKGFESTTLKVTVHFDKDLQKNGSLASIDLPAAAGAKRP